MTTVRTSPILFIRPGTTAGGSPLTLADVELASFFMEPSTVAQAIEAGFAEKEITRALDLGILIADTSGGATIWEVYNWHRAAFLMFNSASDSPADLSAVKSFNPDTDSSHGADFETLMRRRTARFFSTEPVDGQAMRKIASGMAQYLRDKQWLSMYVVVQSVEGLVPGVYRLDRSSGELVCKREGYSRKVLLDCLHGQWWLSGGGVCVFFVISFDQIAQADDSDDDRTPSGYVDALIQVGCAGQELLRYAYGQGLGSWMTPAVSESIAGKLLDLNQEQQEAVYFFKVGVPERASAERRSPI